VRNNGYFKGTNPDWLCGIPEPYIFLKRLTFLDSDSEVYAKLVPLYGRLPLAIFKSK
jgi:hypothetical protein